MEDIFISTGALYSIMIPCWVLAIFIIWMFYVMYKKYLAYIQRKESSDFVEAFIKRKKKALRIDILISVGAFILSAVFFLPVLSFSDAIILSFTFFLLSLIMSLRCHTTIDIFWPKARHG